ncbi:uncharacterized protein LOC118881614 [Balaenoptera musculus]|uniref:Uncharacterized protein LOC118881614 n=1 Tax=Balaenoptera musculus TaxID=9771 RepID=A0A8B8VCV3_BALMU|nr:uncharacterized protein LOC118881614 [Balaenoptera musculus]
MATGLWRAKGPPHFHVSHLAYVKLRQLCSQLQAPPAVTGTSSFGDAQGSLVLPDAEGEVRGEGTATSPVLDQTLLASLAHVLLVGTQRLPLPVQGEASTTHIEAVPHLRGRTGHPLPARLQQQWVPSPGPAGAPRAPGQGGEDAPVLGRYEPGDVCGYRRRPCGEIRVINIPAEERADGTTAPPAAPVVTTLWRPGLLAQSQSDSQLRTLSGCPSVLAAQIAPPMSLPWEQALQRQSLLPAVVPGAHFLLLQDSRRNLLSQRHKAEHLHKEEEAPCLLRGVLFGL